MGSFYRCEFEDCPVYDKVVYAEKSFFKRHLALNHSFDDLIHFAYRKGIIADPYHCPPLSFVINKITEQCRVRSLKTQ